MSVKALLSDDNKQLTIKVDGRFDFSLHTDFRGAYKDLNLANGEFIVDLSATEFVDSSALGMMLLLKEFAESGGSSVRIKTPRPEIREILMIASFDKIFKLE